LLAQWSGAEYARAHEFLLYAPRPVPLRHDLRRMPVRVVPGAGGTWWEQVQLPAALARDGLDVFFAPGYTAPLLTGVPTVVAIHDVSFAAHPEWFTLREGARRRQLTRRTAGNARAVVTISEFSRGELVERFGLPASRVHVIPPGIDAGVPDATASDGTQPNVLYVGSIFNRRHVLDLIRAFGPIARREARARLDIVGDDRSHPPQDLPGALAAAELGERGTWHRYVSDEALRELYAQARAFAFLSEYEGLGLTPLEALAAGVPSVLLDTPVARESCGAAALYVPVDDVAAITRALERLLFDEDIRRSLLARAPEVLARYSWPRAAQQTLALIHGVA
jgi:glycosyltransferase involved in cell wall biosynthesis